MEFKPFPKMARLSRECLISEKLDGTNASVAIIPCASFEGTEDTSDALGVFDGFVVFAGSRTRWITPGKNTDNYGFASWALSNVRELLKLGAGVHFGEWWGCSIQRNYGLHERRFSLFNASRWKPDLINGGIFELLADPVTKAFTSRKGPKCCSVVPVMYQGEFRTDAVNECMRCLKEHGSMAAQGFKDAEGVVVYHIAAGIGFKKTFDDGPKGQSL